MADLIACLVAEGIVIAGMIWFAWYILHDPKDEA